MALPASHGDLGQRRQTGWACLCSLGALPPYLAQRRCHPEGYLEEGAPKLGDSKRRHVLGRDSPAGHRVVSEVPGNTLCAPSPA